MRLFDQTAIPALQQTTAFAQKRHELLAGNLANLDSPGYRARDLSVDQFQAALGDALRYGTDVTSAVGVTTRDERMSGPRQAMEQVVYHDESDVSMESQVTELAKNQHLHSLAITTLRSQFSLLRAAITERA
ncbi:MAG: flagellar basal body rod protein FlgB [Planctomycetota bacterium]